MPKTLREWDLDDIKGYLSYAIERDIEIYDDKELERISTLVLDLLTEAYELGFEAGRKAVITSVEQESGYES